MLRGFEAGAPGNLAQQREIGRRLAVERRDAHQPLDRQAEPVAAGGDESVGVCRQNARFLRLLGNVDLDEARQATAGVLHLAGQRLGEPRTIDAFDHVEQRYRVADLVRLQRPDQMEGKVGK